MAEPLSAAQPKAVENMVQDRSANTFDLGQVRETAPKKKPATPQQNHKVKKKVEAESREKIKHIAEAMDSYVRSVQRDLKIQVHGATGNIMVKVISEDNGKVIREIPPKELLDLAAKMEEMTGTLFNENA